MNENDFRTVALKRADANFTTAPRSTMIKVVTWIVVVVFAAVVVLPLWQKLPARILWTILVADACVILILVAVWFASRIRVITISGQTLSIKMTFWTTAFDLAGLRSVELKPDAFKGSLRSFGNGGLGAFHGYFYSKRMGKFRGYVTDANRAVVLRWEEPAKCVVVSPRDTEFFIEEVCKRTGARRQN